MCGANRAAVEDSGLLRLRLFLLLCRVVAWVGGLVMLVLRRHLLCLLLRRQGLVVMLYSWRSWLGPVQRRGHLEV